MNEIDNDDFTGIYDSLAIVNHGNFVPELTQMLLSCGINPLDHMNYVPSSYMFGTDIDQVEIPQTIRHIGSYAYSECANLVHVNIPEGVVQIDMGAFRSCKSLQTIKLPSTLTKVGDFSLYLCPALSEISYNGTIHEFKTLVERSWNFTSGRQDVKVTCVDGSFMYTTRGGL